jgi:hypothetical protein
VVAGLELVLNIKNVVMKKLGRNNSMSCFSQSSRDKWLVIDSAMKVTATERFYILFEGFPEEIL